MESKDYSICLFDAFDNTPVGGRVGAAIQEEMTQRGKIEPEANEMAAFPPRGHDAFMAHWAKILVDETAVAMAVVVDGRVAGNVGCWTQDGQRLVGYWIGKEFWGQGVATQMLSMFLNVMAERPLQAHVVKHNVASIRVLEKCGFTYCAEATRALGEPADGVEELVYVFDRAESKES